MQVKIIKKKRNIIPYLILLVVTFLATISYDTAKDNVSVEYSARTANIGWTKTRNSNSVKSTSAKSSLDDNNQSFNGLKIKLNSSFSGGISYNMHTCDGNWLDWAKNGTLLDANDKTSINAVKVKLYGSISRQFNIEYRVLTNNNIWSDWAQNGETAGSSNSKNKIIDIEINIVPKENAIESIAKLVKKVTTPESVLDYDSEYPVANIEDEEIPSSELPSDDNSSEGNQKLSKAIKGIDVSYYNGKINWKKVKSDGIKYAIIQVGYRGKTLGTIKADTSFEDNIKGAIEAGIDVGIYFVTQAKTAKEAKAEANYVIKKLSNYTIQYPIYVDIEEVSMSRARFLNNTQRTTVCKTFCDTIKAAGYQAGVYSCKYWFESKLNSKELIDYNLWVAAYNVKSRPMTRFDYQIWQCSETGSVDGISGKVDINYCYVDYLNMANDVVKPSPAPAVTDSPTSEPDPEDSVG